MKNKKNNYPIKHEMLGCLILPGSDTPPLPSKTPPASKPNKNINKENSNRNSKEQN